MYRSLVVLIFALGLTPTVSMAFNAIQGQNYGLTVVDAYGTVSCALEGQTVFRIFGSGDLNTDLNLTPLLNFKMSRNTLECKVEDGANGCFGWTVVFWNEVAAQRNILGSHSSGCCGQQCNVQGVQAYFFENIFTVQSAKQISGRTARDGGPSFFTPSPADLDYMRNTRNPRSQN